MCGGTLRTENGTVTFPSNEGGSNVQGMDCGYRIQTTAGKVMNISFTQLRLRGPASYCPFDVVRVIKNSKSKINGNSNRIILLIQNESYTIM